MKPLRPRVRCLRRKTIINATPTSTRSRGAIEYVSHLGDSQSNSSSFMICSVPNRRYGALKIRSAADFEACQAKKLLFWHGGRETGELLLCVAARSALEIFLFCPWENRVAPRRSTWQAGWQCKQGDEFLVTKIKPDTPRSSYSRCTLWRRSRQIKISLREREWMAQNLRLWNGWT